MKDSAIFVSEYNQVALPEGKRKGQRVSPFGGLVAFSNLIETKIYQS
jgi:hypothetical protein